MLEPWALENGGMKKKVVGILFQNDGLLNASAIHASCAEVRGVRDFTPVTPVAVLPNGAQLSDAKPLARPKFLPDDGRRTLLFLGRLHPKKGLSETLQAWRQLKEIAPHVANRWRLAVVGWDEGGYAETLVRQAISLGLSEDVIFPGAVFGTEKERAFQHADAFILASHSEGFPMAVLEAFANALPVFMTRGCNIPDGFEVGAAVEVTNDPENLARVLARELSRPPEELSEMGERGAKLVAERFSWEKIATDLTVLYKYLLGQSEKRPEFLV